MYLLYAPLLRWMSSATSHFSWGGTQETFWAQEPIIFSTLWSCSWGHLSRGLLSFLVGVLCSLCLNTNGNCKLKKRWFPCPPHSAFIYIFFSFTAGKQCFHFYCLLFCPACIHTDSVQINQVVVNMKPCGLRVVHWTVCVGETEAHGPRTNQQPPGLENEANVKILKTEMFQMAIWKESQSHKPMLKCPA